MASEVAEESISAVRAVKAFNMEEKLVSLLTPPNHEIEYFGRKTARYTAFLVSGMFFVTYSAWALAIYCASSTRRPR